MTVVDLSAIGLILRWAMCVIGLAYLVTQSAVFAIPRMRVARRGPWWETFVYCPVCVGWWVAFGAGLAGLYPFCGALDVVGALESAVASCAVTHLWSTATGGNHAYDVEAPIIHDEATTTEARAPSAHGDDDDDGRDEEDAPRPPA